MLKTIAFVTNQPCSDRLILTASGIACETDTELIVVNVLDSEYEIDPHVVEEHFNQSRRYKATMRLIFAENKLEAMREVLSQSGVGYVLTGMPASHSSVLYPLWKEFADKEFFTVDDDGLLIEVDTGKNTARLSHVTAAR